ncbi:hypothetical protein BO86DRAFT_405057 [Aspergillus japonicus CBS 114.51]|uniref:F-box domain-containing protein n=1 Tax=Aspergillus japonicus CBS 114.51 TaxID=1448312 RepID=A0A8T8WJW7_ASPJA|nr:hypothetical protein BO86DRAFT_405057 [Aspergillus japonicus CBS 114.51]RAH76003.1 hypothetical protein BO86DRAFT_405057 [Aspergillus japonicus CBS 114.51]
MAETTPHRIFCIPELVEQILLQMDMQTLLISTRVCYLWHDLISKSQAMQTSLFFQPAENTPQGERRTINPLIIQKIWPEYLTSSNTCHREYYERPEASWRRMLLHQPPTAKLCLLNYMGDYYFPITPHGAGYMCASLCRREGFPRLQELQKELEASVLRTFDARRKIFVEGSPQYSGGRFWGIIRPRSGSHKAEAGSYETCELLTCRGASHEAGAVSEGAEQQVEPTAGSLFWIALPWALARIKDRFGNYHRPDRPLKGYHYYVGLDEVPIFPFAQGWRRYYDDMERDHKLQQDD